MVLDALGVHRKVLHTFEYNICENLVELEFEGDQDGFACTLDHEIMSADGQWIPAKRLTFAEELGEV